MGSPCIGKLKPSEVKEKPQTSCLLSYSGMDIFPTVLSLAGVTPPSDRRYDGIDATDIVLQPGHTGREVQILTVTICFI